MNPMQKAYEAMPPEDREQFWAMLHKAVLWRGWDEGGKHTGLFCHACDFISRLDKLCVKNGVEFEEYT
jgi:hypothetical protein